MCCGSHNHSGSDASSKLSRMHIVISLVVGLAAVVGILVYAGQGPRLVSWLPFMVLLACPLMHLFMGMGHRRHAHAPQDTKDGENRRNCH